MKALVVPDHSTKTLDDLKITSMPVPDPTADQVLVKVHATGLNPVDYKLVESGVASWSYPHVLGLDLAGEIVQTGSSVHDWHVGDRVAGHGNLLKDGCFAEYVIVPTYQLARIPENVSYEQAAALLCGALTAYTAINRKPNLSHIHTALIQAGAGSVGSLAIQFAKLHDIKVITTVSTSKVNFVKQLHPDAVIDYQKEDVDLRVRDFTHGLGVDLAVDTISKAEATRDLHRLAYNGTLVTIVDIPDIDDGFLFDHALNIDTVNLGGAHSSNNSQQQADLGQMAKEVLQLCAHHQIDPLIEEVLPFEKIVTGLQMIKHHDVVGKLVVKVSA